MTANIGASGRVKEAICFFIDGAENALHRYSICATRREAAEDTGSEHH